MKSNTLELIKRSGSVRKFKSKRIKSKLLNLIIEGGVWGPSLFGIQPWHFKVIKYKKDIHNISLMVNAISKKRKGGLAKLLEISSRIIEESDVLIAVSIDDRVIKNAGKFGGSICRRKGWMAELLATGGAIQNMFLVANEIGLGVVWLDAPTIFSDRICKYLSEKNELISFLAIGYPNQEIKRSKRRYQNIVTVI